MAGMRDAGRDERLTLEDHVALAKAPKLRPGGVRQAVERMAGEAWNAPNQAVGFQSRQLGPAYLPSNLLGGLNAKLHGEKWGGPHNWNEQGPKMNPPGGWPPKSR